VGQQAGGGAAGAFAQVIFGEGAQDTLQLVAHVEERGDGADGEHHEVRDQQLRGQRQAGESTSGRIVHHRPE
jgi:hypothetical protein